MTSSVFRIIFYQVACEYHRFDFCACNHTIRACHLPDRVGKKQKSLCRRDSYLFENVIRHEPLSSSQGSPSD